MKTRLSHSSVSEYNECGYKYYLNRVAKIRPEKAKSALLFGTAVDCGINKLLETKDLLLAINAFQEKWLVGNINYKEVKLKDSDLVIYSKKDFDPDLGDTPWECMMVKGEYLIEAYNRDILPRLIEIEEIQGESSIHNEEGDEVVTKRDLVAVMDDSHRYLLDNKTSSGLYPKNAAEEAQQLLLYYYLEHERLKLDGIGFLVVNKDLKKEKQLYCKKCDVIIGSNRLKNCQKCKTVLEHKETKIWAETQVLLNNNISLNKLDKSIEIMDNANHGISNQIFEKNLNSCHNYGGCPYRGLCERGSMDSLIDMSDKK